MWKPELTHHISRLLHGGFDASRMAAGQMAGLVEGLSRGMTRPDLCCVWEMDNKKIEAERLVRRLTLI